jgi:hypothetical protein
MRDLRGIVITGCSVGGGRLELALNLAPAGKAHLTAV